MSAPRYTVIVPMVRFRPDEPVLLGLRVHPPPDRLQVIVAEGRQPARQRNLALGRAEGEIVVFLDNDCRIDDRYWAVLEDALRRPEVAIVGGPARLQLPARRREHIFHALLSHRLVVGPVAARYTPRGGFRRTTQTELILCNLAVRRSLFREVGSLSTELYPNEENEWLDRAQALGAGIYYEPALQIFRPQRATGFQLLRMLVRYGIGRTRQWRVSGWRITRHQLLPLVAMLPFLLLLAGRLGVLALLLLWLLGAAVIAATCAPALGWTRRILAGLVAPTFPLAYALGQLLGWFTLLAPREAEPPPIRLVNESGEELSTVQGN